MDAEWDGGGFLVSASWVTISNPAIIRSPAMNEGLILE